MLGGSVLLADASGDLLLLADASGHNATPAPGAAVPLINANGNMSNNIAIKLAVSTGGDGGRHYVTSMWDWGPVASWDGGASWPIGDWNPNGKPAAAADATAAAAATATDDAARGAISVELETEHGDADCHRDLTTNFWVPRPTLARLGIPLDSKGRYPCGGKIKSNVSCGSIAVNGVNVSLDVQKMPLSLSTALFPPRHPVTPSVGNDKGVPLCVVQPCGTRVRVRVCVRESKSEREGAREREGENETTETERER